MKGPNMQDDHENRPKAPQDASDSNGLPPQDREGAAQAPAEQPDHTDEPSPEEREAEKLGDFA
jgi:hypothetical protein